MYQYPSNTLRLKRFPPENMLIKCRAVFKEVIDVNPLEAFTNKQIFYRANSIHDFTVALGPAQVRPNNYTFLSETFDHYCVVGSKVTFRATNHDINDGINMYVTKQDTAIAYSESKDLIQQYDAKTIILAPSRGAGNTKRATLRFSMNKDLGNRDPNNAKMGANFGANPTESFFFNLSFEHTDPGVGNESRITVEGSVVFWVLCTELQDNVV